MECCKFPSKMYPGGSEVKLTYIPIYFVTFQARQFKVRHVSLFRLASSYEYKMSA